MRRANYHTHTPRCQHAIGSEREYIEAAISAGFEVLGFSDHVPQPYQSYVSGIRMTMDKLPEYVDTLLKLREEYQEQIDIKIGFEAEYIPELFDELMEIMEQYPIDYFILGQHFLAENEGEYTGSPTTDAAKMKKYVDLVVAGLKTGKFAYLAHPDLMYFEGDNKVYIEEMTRLCKECKAMGIPLELNGLGMWENRNYPSERFFKIAKEVGNEIVIGYDAHNPTTFLNEEIYQNCMKFARSLGIQLNEGFRI